MFCNSFLDNFIPKFLKANKKQQFSIQKLRKSAQSLFNPLFNLGLRFFSNIQPYSDYIPYCLLEDFNKGFPKTALKPEILTLNPP